MAEAGYRNVELVGEYAKWTDADFERAIAAHASRSGSASTPQLAWKMPATRMVSPILRCRESLFWLSCEQALTPMERLGCPAMIVLSGDTVPGLSREAQHASCIEGLKQAAKLVEGKQIDGQPVRLLLECILMWRSGQSIF